MPTLLGEGSAPMVGRVCMDHSFADVTHLGPDAVSVGATAVLLGAKQSGAVGGLRLRP